MPPRPFFALRSVTALLLLILAACGKSGPDLALAQKRILDSVNMEAEGKAELRSFTETKRKEEEIGGVRSCLLDYDGELGFTGDCHYHQPRKKGDTMAITGTFEFMDDGNGWSVVAASVHPR